jgi:hypothetical protein
VTASLKDVTFDTALQNLLRQVDATYRIEGGVYNIILRVPDEPTIDNLLYENADIREALQGLFRKVGVSYTIAPEVQGLVTCSLSNVSLSTALSQLLRPVGATWLVEGGIYRIVRRDALAAATTPPAVGSSRHGMVSPRLNLPAPSLGGGPVTASDAFKKLLTAAKVRYAIQEGLSMKVLVNFSGLKIGQALTALKAATGASVRLVSGCYVVTKR